MKKKKNEAFTLFVENCKKEINDELNNVQILQDLIDVKLKRIEKIENDKFNYFFIFDILVKDSIEDVFLICTFIEENNIK